jgi:hypothetical protein
MPLIIKIMILLHLNYKIRSGTLNLMLPVKNQTSETRKEKENRCSLATQMRALKERRVNT